MKISLSSEPVDVFNVCRMDEQMHEIAHQINTAWKNKKKSDLHSFNFEGKQKQYSRILK